MHEMTGLLEAYGLAFVFVNVFLVQAGAPVPAVPALVVAGALSKGGAISMPAVIAVAVIASLLADSLWYELGRRYGTRVLRLLCRMSIAPDTCARQTEDRFLRWGAPSLVFAKFIPGFALVAPPLAGALRVRFVSFLFYSAISAALWALLAVGAGMLFARQVDWALATLEQMGVDALLVLAVGLALFIAYKWWARDRLIRHLRMTRISAAELNRITEQGLAPVVVDVRSKGARSFDPRRIPGALLADIESMDQVLAQLPRNRDIILYCT